MTHSPVFLTRTAAKSLKKLDKPILNLVQEALLKIANNPAQQGERLSQPFHMVYSHHFKYKGKEFRIAYQFSSLQESVIILLVGPHENFYRRIKLLLDAS